MVTHWHPVGDTTLAWSHQRRTKNGWTMRSVAARTREGRLAIFSPTRNLGDEVHADLVELGMPAFLVAPNIFHNLGVAEHRERYPDARFVASEAAHARLERRVGARPEDLGELEAELAGGVSLLHPAGLKSGEVWLRVETPRGIAWSVTDSFFHCDATPKGLFGMGCRITGTTPGLRIGRTFVTLAIADRRAYRRWVLERLEADQPRILLTAHGEVLEADDLPARLQALTEARL